MSLDSESSYKKIGKVTTESVFKCTGKHWEQWIAILNKAGARSWTYKELVVYLKKKHRLGPWWQHGVASGFEIAAGKRVEGQNQKGEYMVTSTKSIGVGVGAIWDYLLSVEGMRVWLKPLSPLTIKVGAQFETLDGYFGEVRTMKKHRRVRMTWQDPEWERKTVVELHLVARPGKKSILVFNHMQLLSTKQLAALRKRWKAVMAELTPLP